MTPLDWVYVIGFAMLVIGEIIAVVSKTPERPTISSRVIGWLKKNPKKRRAMLIVGLIWLVWHWGFQPF